MTFEARTVYGVVADVCDNVARMATGDEEVKRYATLLANLLRWRVKEDYIAAQVSVVEEKVAAQLAAQLRKKRDRKADGVDK